MQEALNQKIDAFVAANKEQILKDIATLLMDTSAAISFRSCSLFAAMNASIF